MDATEVRVRRPAAGRAGRDRFVSGKARLNTMKALVICDPLGRLLFCGETRPGLDARHHPGPLPALAPTFSQPGALPAAKLEQVIAAVAGLDMDDVRAKIAAKAAAAKR
ncbi:transposase family protein [Micromonospora rifamycinica]|uniref:transposase family protein n=1 Tax=Micromonospora rifamycinica TaxID=291594 RepID=UPI002E2BDC56|nr:transposase family protein [Micromonospora rifamycinica]